MSARVLIVDDEARNLELLDALLRPLGAEVVRAYGGREALALFEEREPDLVLLDLMMPGFDGLDTMAHIRARPGGGEVPVVLVTAHAEREQRLRGIEAGADEFLEKPVDGPVLLARARTLLRLRESRKALAASHAELARRHAALERLQREQRDMTQFLVHDLKNPLSIVYTNVDWAREQAAEAGGDPELLKALGDANEAAERLHRLIDDLLAVARLEESAFPLQLRPVAVADLVRAAAAAFARRAEGRRVDLALPPSAQAARARVDETLLRRVVENLLDNALRHTPASGRVAVEVGGGAGVRIAVSNTGPPIPPGERRRVFEKFSRLGGERSPSGGNAGLGLYFCKRAVEAQGGAIEVVETPEWPTSFVIRLPPS
ncbi:MAG TPA: hybrid sensor histidine kinase/response regulator [Polyangiaceae bacterium]|nr:hybrid sensor histidine kinase/response regulator [Polyangiaceae bacterium]